MDKTSSMNKTSLFSSQKGFTLLEVLVAMAITLFVTVIAYTSLTAAINGAEGARDAAEDLAMLQAGLGLLERDARHPMQLNLTLMMSWLLSRRET